MIAVTLFKKKMILTQCLRIFQVINAVRNVLFHSIGDNFIDMNEVNPTYNNLLGNSIENQINQKHYLENL